MSKKTVYKFFPSKEDLVEAFIHSMMEQSNIVIEQIVSSSKPFIEKANDLFTFVGRQIGCISKQLIIDLQRFSPDLWKEVEEFRRQRILTNMRSMFSQATNERLLRKDVNIELFFLVFIGAVQNVISPQTLAEQSFSTEEALHGIVKIMFEGVLTDEAHKQFISINNKSRRVLHKER